MRWEVQITGDAHDLEKLSASLTSGDTRILKRDNEYFLDGTLFHPLGSVEDVRTTAEELVTLLSGAAALSLESRTPIRVANVAQVSDTGEHHINVWVHETISFGDSWTVTKVSADGTTETSRPGDVIPHWLKVAQRNSNVAKVLRLLGDSPRDWVSLYRIFEVIEANVGGLDGICAQGWASKVAMRRFKHTANSPKAIGDSARHGSESTDPPSRPMDLGEVRSLIRSVVHSWLASR
jgi:hypothetical protein